MDCDEDEKVEGLLHSALISLTNVPRIPGVSKNIYTLAVACPESELYNFKKYSHTVPTYIDTYTTYTWS